MQMASAALAAAAAAAAAAAVGAPAVLAAAAEALAEAQAQAAMATLGPLEDAALHRTSALRELGEERLRPLPASRLEGEPVLEAPFF